MGRAALAMPERPGATAPWGLDEVCAAAQAGDPGALQVLREAGELLGEAVHNARMLTDPESSS